MTSLALSAAEARRFLVRRQLLDPPRALPASPGSVLAVVERLGSLQFDPLEVPGARSHDLVLHARIAGFERAHCDALLYGALIFWTLGYDTISKAFVGTFVVSCMAYLWVYRGQLDSSGTTLTLDTEGPNISGDGLAKYQDIITIHSKDHRTLESQVQAADGSWTKFMMAHYHREL